jgi:hypothetical protein
MKLPNPLFLFADVAVLVVLVWELWRLNRHDRK